MIRMSDREWIPQISHAQDKDGNKNFIEAKLKQYSL